MHGNMPLKLKVNTRKIFTSMFMRMIGIARQKNTNTALAASG